MRKKILSFIAVMLIALTALGAASGEKLGLVLSGGGARGLAHIEVIRELEKRGIHPDVVVGTSMGALVGAFYAAGYTADEIEELITSTDMVGLFMHLHARGETAGKFEYGDELLSNIATIDFNMEGLGAANGVIDDQEIAAFLRSNLARVLPVKDFNELSIPFACVGADLVSGKELVFNGGNLFNAIRSSMSLPIFFTPVYLENEDRYVIDGGIANNLPIDIAREMGAEVILAVDVNDSTDIWWSEEKAQLDTLSGTISQFMDLTSKFNSVAQYEREAEEHPDDTFIIVPHLNGYRTMEFWKYEDILRLGRECVEANEDVFDVLEKRVEEKDAPLNYFDRPSWTIEGFIYKGLEKYASYFEYMKGREATEATISEFEEMLNYIKKHERLKSITYEVSDGLIFVDAVPYEVMSSSVSVGLGGEIGVNAGLWDEKRALNFYASPQFSLFADMGFGSHAGSLLFGINSTSALNLFAGYYYPITKNIYYYGSLQNKIGSLSMLSIPTRWDMIDTLDYGITAETGFLFGFKNMVDMSFCLTMDNNFLGVIKDPREDKDIMDRTYIPVPEARLALNYRGREDMNLFIPGVSAGLDFSIALWDELMYDFTFKIEGSAPAVGRTIFFFEAEAGTYRGHELLASSYTTTRRGDLTRDYAEFVLGGRILVSDHFFVDVAGYAEGFEARPYDGNKFWEHDESYSLIPFAMMDDWDVGASVGLGLSYETLSLVLDFGLSGKGTMTVSLSFL